MSYTLSVSEAGAMRCKWRTVAWLNEFRLALPTSTRMFFDMAVSFQNGFQAA